MIEAAAQHAHHDPSVTVAIILLILFSAYGAFLSKYPRRLKIFSLIMAVIGVSFLFAPGTF